MSPVWEALCGRRTSFHGLSGANYIVGRKYFFLCFLFNKRKSRTQKSVNLGLISYSANRKSGAYEMASYNLKINCICDTNLSEFLRNTVASIYKCIRQSKKILHKKNVKRYLQRF